MPNAALAVATRIALLWVTLQAVGVCLTGAAIAAGGPGRFRGPSFRLAEQIAPHWAWAAAFLTFGLLMLATALRRDRCVLWASLPPAAMYGLLAGSMAFSAGHPLVPLTGPVTYSGLLVLTTTSAIMARWVFTIDRVAAMAVAKAAGL